MKTSLVICTRNRMHSLARTLATVATQQVREPWEVLVVDNGSEDDTRSLVDSLRGDFPVPLRLGHEARQGLSHARNRGVAEAKGELLVFTDDDVDCRPGFVQAHANAIHGDGHDGASGRVLPRLPDDTDPTMRAILLSGPGGPAGSYDMGDDARPILGEGQGPLLPFGANMSVRRELALALGGFRPELGVGRRLVAGEETDFFARALEQGARLVYRPEAVVEHRVQRDHTSAEYLERWWLGRGRAVVIARRASLASRGPAVLRELLRVQRDTIRLALAGSDERARIEAAARRAFSRGRLLELLGR